MGFFRGRRIPVPGRPARCVDATGAGDAFWGALLSLLRFRGVTRAEELTAALVREAMAYGNVGGWLCVQSKGAIVVPAHPGGDPAASGLTGTAGKFGIDKRKTSFYNRLCKGAPARGLRGGASPST